MLPDVRCDLGRRDGVLVRLRRVRCSFCFRPAASQANGSGGSGWPSAGCPPTTRFHSPISGPNPELSAAVILRTSRSIGTSKTIQPVLTSPGVRTTLPSNHPTTDATNTTQQAESGVSNPPTPAGSSPSMVTDPTGGLSPAATLQPPTGPTTRSAQILTTVPYNTPPSRQVSSKVLQRPLETTPGYGRAV
jgi:hypothetical protein